MNLGSIQKTITSTVGSHLLSVQTKSPALLFGAGVVGFVGTIVLATRATLKLEPVLAVAQETLQLTVIVVDAPGEPISKRERQKHITKVYLMSAVEVAKLYAPAFAVGVISIAALTSSHVILTRRNAALGVAYATIQKSYAEYRERVVKEYGTLKDLEFRHGSETREVAVDTDDGVAVKTVKTFDPNKISGYARIFDESCPDWRKNAEANLMYLRSQQNYANDLFQTRGHVFLNEVYDMIGVPRSSAGQIVGWVRGEGDDFISFGLYEDNPAAADFVNGRERSFLLDFNVTGNMFTKIEHLASDPMYTR